MQRGVGGVQLAEDSVNQAMAEASIVNQSIAGA